MGAERHDSKSGLLQLFGWNSKSRKKSFSAKSTVPESSKQRRCDGSLPMTLLHLVDEDDIHSGSSMKESSDFSCASSVTDEEFSVSKGPNIVARLMGLDSLPTRDFTETRSTTFLDTHSLQDFNLQPKRLENRRDYHLISSGNLHVKMEGSNRDFLEKKQQKLSNMPIKKFQTEKLPPKSAKSIPITHHKLLSPIKRANYIQSDDAARIMEAAARITCPGSQATTTKPKLPILAQKEKEAVQKPWKLPETSFRGRDSNTLKQSMIKSWNGSIDKTSVKGSVESGECSTTSAKDKGKSISLALQAKANVQKREALSSSRGSKTSVASRESNELILGESGTQKGSKKKPSSLGSSNVLRQNNQKQNSYGGGGDSRKMSYKQQPISNGEDSLIARYTCPTKSAENKVVIRSNEATRSNSRTISRKKRSTERNFNGEKSIQSQPNKRQGTDDVISFTFTSPMTKSDRDPNLKNTGSGDFRSIIQSLPNKDGFFNSHELMGGNVVDSDALSTLLDQKLRELTRGFVMSADNAGTGETCSSNNHGLTSTDSSHARKTKLKQTDEIASSFDSVFTSNDFPSSITKHKIQGLNQEVKKYGENDVEAKTVVEYRTPSPVSVLEHSFLEDSCNSSDTADNSVAGGDSKQSPFIQAQEAISPSTRFIPLESSNVEFLHSFSSHSTPGFSAKQMLTPSSNDPSLSTQFELDYIKKIVHNITPMFENFAAGKTSRIITSQLFIQLECQNGFKNEHLPVSRRRLMFDYVAEYLDNRCRRHTGGGYEAWVEGMALMKREKRLAEEILKEIMRLNDMGDCMVDELVDKDMSFKHGGKWVEFEIESFEVGIEVEDQILNGLLDEIIADIL